MNTYSMEALNLYDTISIKAIRSVLTGKVLDSSPQALQLQYGDASYGFVFRFGCIVFFNLSPDRKETEIAKLKEVLGATLPQITSESYQVNVGESANQVEFEYVALKKMNLDELRLIARTLGQSAALEYFEIQADRMLHETSASMQGLAEGRALPLLWRNLLRRIGSAAGTRQHIISSIAVLDSPDETWKSKELERLHQEIQENFDIATRSRILDRKLSLVQDNIEILADLASSKRSALLEALIVVLIVVELVLRLAESFK